MKLDRNESRGPVEGAGKYALLNVRKLNEQFGGYSTFQQFHPDIQAALDTLDRNGLLQWGETGSEDEFFVIKLKDRHAEAALRAYADSIRTTDREFCREVEGLADRAGPHSPWCKEPD